MSIERRPIRNATTQKSPFLRTAFTMLGARGSNFVSWVSLPDMARQRAECALRVVAEFEVTVKRIVIAESRVAMIRIAGVGRGRSVRSELELPLLGWRTALVAADQLCTS
jgi:hypothetical protein